MIHEYILRPGEQIDVETGEFIIVNWESKDTRGDNHRTCHHYCVFFGLSQNQKLSP